MTTLDDAIAAGDGTLHGAIDHWQERALKAEAERDAALARVAELESLTIAQEWVRLGKRDERAEAERAAAIAACTAEHPEVAQLKAERDEALKDAK